MPRTISINSLFCTCVALVSCSTSPERDIRLEQRRLGSLALHVFGDVLLGGQPRPEDFAALKQSGVRTVVTLRRHGELAWGDEGNIARSYGFEFHRVPFQDAEELTDDVFDRVRELLLDSQKRPLLLHCSSANRVAAVWLTHRALDDDLDIESARIEARVVGLRTAAYERKALDYIARQRQRQKFR